MRVHVLDDDERLRSVLCATPWAELREDADVALVDVHLGGYGGACRRLAPHVRVALTTSRYDDVPARFADQFGALGVIAKDAPPDELRAALEQLARGVQVDVRCRRPARLRLHPLDREILRLAAEGRTNQEIGALVHLSPGTVKQHTRALYRRLGVESRAGAVHVARELGVIPRPDGAALTVSPRERDVLAVLATGATNAEIAGRLGLSPHTVKQHTRSIYRKLGVRNRAEAAMRI
jgi:DNA-binding NarL/FixJ family response regulator